jgi:hypothetical protein
LREELRLRVFESRVLNGMFGPKRDEVTGEWSKLRSEELHILYSSPNINRQIKSRRMWHTWWKREKYVQGFVGKSEGKIPLGTPRRK